MVLGCGLFLEVTTGTDDRHLRPLRGSCRSAPRQMERGVGREGGEASCSGLPARTWTGGFSAGLQSPGLSPSRQGALLSGGLAHVTRGALQPAGSCGLAR